MSDDHLRMGRLVVVAAPPGDFAEWIVDGDNGLVIHMGFLP